MQAVGDRGGRRDDDREPDQNLGGRKQALEHARRRARSRRTAHRAARRGVARRRNLAERSVFVRSGHGGAVQASGARPHAGPRWAARALSSVAMAGKILLMSPAPSAITTSPGSAIRAIWSGRVARSFTWRTEW